MTQYAKLDNIQVDSTGWFNVECPCMHHSIATRYRMTDDMTLEDVAQAGVEEHCRRWRQWDNALWCPQCASSLHMVGEDRFRRLAETYRRIFCETNYVKFAGQGWTVRLEE